MFSDRCRADGDGTVRFMCSLCFVAGKKLSSAGYVNKSEPCLSSVYGWKAETTGIVVLRSIRCFR